MKHAGGSNFSRAKNAESTFLNKIFDWNILLKTGDSEFFVRENTDSTFRKVTVQSKIIRIFHKFLAGRAGEGSFSLLKLHLRFFLR